MLFNAIVFALTASVARAAPFILDKRIQQTISDSTAKWEQACLAAGGGLNCNPLSVTAFTTLLAAAGPCEQQDAADSMIQLAQSLNNDPEMIKLTQIFIQQPRNTNASQTLSLPHPLFFPAFPMPVPRRISCWRPWDRSVWLEGPIADGTQLVNLTQDPGVGSSESGPASSSTPEATSTAVVPPAATSAAAVASPSSASDFHLQNGLDAQKLNAQFQSLTASSLCAEGEQACVGTSFAQCVSGSFVLTPCASGTVCAALPLVNKPGTSIACDTSSDVAARIAATGAPGGVDGSASSTPSASSPDSDSDSDSDPDCDDSDGFKAQNGLDAQKLNAQFKTLTSSSACTDGEEACVGTSFAQCVLGSFVLTPCSGGTICTALPLVNKPGTSITCDTLADAQARIAATGAAGGIAGLS
ncbi:hypothetical protein B0H13DRAFT_2054731 [Mycena leptocephala]|nr:hypothetical protein B0H13DRAFT_2054731 [Mycena leptocephala]